MDDPQDWGMKKHALAPDWKNIQTG